MTTDQLYQTIMKADITAINQTLAGFDVGAWVPARTFEEARRHSMIALSSHCAYALAFRRGVPFKAVENVGRELDRRSP